MPLNELFDNRQLDALQEAVFQILTRTGMVYQSDKILDALEARGAIVDRESQTAKLPVDYIQELIAGGSAQKLEEWKESRSSGDYRTAVGLQIAPFYYDYDKKERRESNREDLITVTRFGDAFDTESTVSQALLIREEPPAVEPLEALYLLMQHTSRPGYVYPHFANQMDYLAEIGEIYCGDRLRFLIGGIFLVSPMRMDRRSADLMAKRAEFGLTTGIGTMPVAGISAPVTAAGVIALGAAEIIAAWAALRAIKPDANLGGGICSGSMDMRTSNCSFGSPESMLQDLGTVELFRKRFGGRVGVAGGPDYTSAKLPGIQATFEKTFEALTLAAYTGAAPHFGEGLLEQGKTFAPVQFILDHELGSFLWQFGRGVEVSPETLALDVMEQIGHGFTDNFLNTDHTAEHFRKAVWQPALLDRTTYDTDQAEIAKEAGLLDRANQRFHDVLNAYTPPQPDPKKMAEIRKVIDRARKELL